MKTIDFRNKKLNVKYSFRALMIYENINGKSFNPTGLSDVITFFYSILVASNRNEQIDFEDFMDWLDENPYAIQDFSEWITAEVVKQNQLIKEQPTEKEVKEAEENSKN